MSEIKLTRSVEMRDARATLTAFVGEATRALAIGLATIALTIAAIAAITWMRDCVVTDARWEREMERGK